MKSIDEIMALADDYRHADDCGFPEQAALRAALEAALKPGVEPVAYEVRYSDGSFSCLNREPSRVKNTNSIPLYYAPPAQTPPRLTDEQIDAIWPSPEGTNSIRALARAIETAVRKQFLGDRDE